MLTKKRLINSILSFIFSLVLVFVLPTESIAYTPISSIGNDSLLEEVTNQAIFNNPVAMAKTKDKIYVADMGNHRIVTLDYSGNVIGKFGKLGNNPGEFNTPFGVAVDNKGNILVADTANNRIQKFDSGFNFITYWGTEGNGPSQFGLVREIAIDRNNNYHVCDEFHDRIQVFNENGEFMYQYGGRGSENGKFALP